MFLSAVALAEFLDLVAALEGGLGRVGEVVAASRGDNDGDLFPLAGAERAAFEGVPFLLVRADEVHRLLVGPRDRLGFLDGGGGGRGWRSCHFRVRV